MDLNKNGLWWPRCIRNGSVYNAMYLFIIVATVVTTIIPGSFALKSDDGCSLHHDVINSVTCKEGQRSLVRSISWGHSLLRMDNRDD